MTASRSVLELNAELARQINEEALHDPTSPYAGKFVGLANGQVVVVANDADEMVRALQRVEPDPRKCYGLQAGVDEEEVHEIWGLD